MGRAGRDQWLDGAELVRLASDPREAGAELPAAHRPTLPEQGGGELGRRAQRGDRLLHELEALYPPQPDDRIAGELDFDPSCSRSVVSPGPSPSGAHLSEDPGSVRKNAIARATACPKSDNYMRARSEHLRQLAHKCAMKAAAANNPVTKARLEQERKQLLTLAEQAEKAERNLITRSSREERLRRPALRSGR